MISNLRIIAKAIALPCVTLAQAEHEEREGARLKLSVSDPACPVAAAGLLIPLATEPFLPLIEIGTMNRQLIAQARSGSCLIKRLAHLSFILLAGCSLTDPIMQYHGPDNDCTKHHMSLTHCSDQRLEESDGYTLGFIEVDDEGWFHDRNQLQAIEDTVENSSNVLLFVFAHGWKHNADNEDRDLNRVRSILRHLSNQQSNEGRDIVGLFVGWRGESLSVKYLNNLSFYERKKTAHEIGDAVHEVLGDLQRIIDRKRAHGEEVSYVIVGHSFGGAVVFSAMKPYMISKEKAKQGDVEPEAAKASRSSADMILLINPAFEASKARELLDVYKNSEGAPYLVVLTADNDAATGFWFRAGRTASNTFDSHVDAEQARADVRAIGHYKPYTTHLLEDIDGPGSGCGQLSDRTEGNTEVASYAFAPRTDLIAIWNERYPQPGHELPLRDSVVKHLNGSSGDSEYKSPMAMPDSKIQIVKVMDRDILDKHSNIVCDDLIDLIQTYMIFGTQYGNDRLVN